MACTHWKAKAPEKEVYVLAENNLAILVSTWEEKKEEG